MAVAATDPDKASMPTPTPTPTPTLASTSLLTTTAADRPVEIESIAADTATIHGDNMFRVIDNNDNSHGDNDGLALPISLAAPAVQQQQQHEEEADIPGKARADSNMASPHSRYFERVFGVCDVRQHMLDYVQQRARGVLPMGADGAPLPVLPLDAFLAIAYEDQRRARMMMTSSTRSTAAAAAVHADTSCNDISSNAVDEEASQILNKLRFDFLNEVLRDVVSARGAIAANLPAWRLRDIAVKRFELLHRAGCGSELNLLSPRRRRQHLYAQQQAATEAERESRRLRAMATHVSTRLVVGENTAQPVDERMDIVCGLSNIIFQQVLQDTVEQLMREDRSNNGRARRTKRGTHGDSRSVRTNSSSSSSSSTITTPRHATRPMQEHRSSV